MSFEIGVAMIALGIGAFSIGVVVGRWPSWTRRRRVSSVAVCVVTLSVVGVVSAFLASIVVPPWSYTHLILSAGSGLYLKDNEHPERYQSRAEDGWGRPFVQRLSVEQAPSSESDQEESRDFLAFEVRSLGPNGVLDDDDIWVQFEVVREGGRVKLIGRRWGGMSENRPDAWTFPYEERADVQE